MYLKAEAMHTYSLLEVTGGSEGGLSRKIAGSTRKIWLHIKILVHSNHCYVLSALPKKKKIWKGPQAGPLPWIFPSGYCTASPTHTTSLDF